VPCVGRRSPDDDRSRHHRAVNGTIVLIGTRRGEQDLVCAAVAGLDCAARKARRAQRLDAVGNVARTGPGPGDGATRGDGVDGRVGRPVVPALEEDGADGDGRGERSRAAAGGTAGTAPRRAAAGGAAPSTPTIWSAARP